MHDSVETEETTTEFPALSTSSLSVVQFTEEMRSRGAIRSDLVVSPPLPSHAMRKVTGDVSEWAD